ncbi:glycosyltransferase family 4 protein [Geofilum sp. OHC36d9]|uniref:glycosyltransferase family 4 protein n=1 Tax=Geofilum sp. OHC36d9 TaxID=3458413 RepID=UPI00403474B4
MNDYILFIKVVGAGLMAFIIVFISIPTILNVAYFKNLFDEPGKRRVHKHKIPNLGGMGIFLGVVFTFLLYGDLFHSRDIPFLIPAAIVIFAIGIKDDILITAPIMKLLGQLVAAFIIVGLGDVRITDFHGFFGLEPDYFWSMFLSILFVVFILNGFNLIDGVDGLAAFAGIITISTFSFWFYFNGFEAMPVLGTIIVGSLTAFVYYNVFSVRQKIFMGDTGSLLIGLFVAVFAIKFMEANTEPMRQHLKFFTMTSAPAVTLGVIIVPVIDTLRVFFRRISLGQSPFVADKSHIHHRLLTLGLTHLQISLVLASVNIFFIVLSFWLRNFGTVRLLVLNFVTGWLVFQIPSLLIHFRMKKMRKEGLSPKDKN